MRLEYKPTVLERVIDAIFEAEDAGRQLERVVLTRSEWAELSTVKAGSFLQVKDGETYVNGIPVVEETRPTITVKRESTYSAASMHQNFDGR